MGTTTTITWTDHTWNPWIGCTHSYIGCKFCYAEAHANRFGAAKWGANGTRVITSPANWKLPLKWNKQAEKAGVRAKVFCASLADAFEDWGGKLHNSSGEVLIQSYLGEVRDSFDETCNGPWEKYPDKQAYKLLTLDDIREDLFKLIDATPWLDWQLLTKRPENIRRMWPNNNTPMGPCEYRAALAGESNVNHRHNVWLLTSVSDQQTADKMIPELLKCRNLVPVLGVSYEPALGPVDFGPMLGRNRFDDPEDGLDWVIVGGESGPKARPCNIRWISTAIEQCQAAGVACFVKQMGADFRLQDGRSYHFDDRKGGDWNQWHHQLKVRQFPLITTIADSESGVGA